MPRNAAVMSTSTVSSGEARQPAPDDVLDALGHRRRRVGRLAPAAQQLLDEERVAAGLLVQLAGSSASPRPSLLGRRAPPCPVASSPRARCGGGDPRGAGRRAAATAHRRAPPRRRARWRGSAGGTPARAGPPRAAAAASARRPSGDRRSRATSGRSAAAARTSSTTASKSRWRRRSAVRAAPAARRRAGELGQRGAAARPTASTADPGV